MIKNTKLVNAKTGEPFSVEFLAQDPATERFVLFYKPSLQRIGMTVNVRLVDSAQYENRLRQWDFDIITATWGESLSPGNEQRGYWGSAAADQPGSRNLVGIKNPAVDKLIERVIYAKDRDELVAATHALDRVLLWNFYVVPQWTYGKQRTARWDRFGRPRHMPKYGLRRVPDHLVVGQGKGGQGAAAVVMSPCASAARSATRGGRPAQPAGSARESGSLTRLGFALSADPLPQGRGTSSRGATFWCLPPAAVAASQFGGGHAQPAERHGMSAFGDLALPADFKHFPYVNPDAPKGGKFSQIGAQPQLQSAPSSPSIRSTATSSRATARSAWSSPSPR